MNTKTYQNTSRRLVSIQCNSGEYRHIPAGARLELSEVEVKNNSMVEKLLKRCVLLEMKSVRNSDTNKKSAAPEKRAAPKAKKDTASDSKS